MVNPLPEMGKIDMGTTYERVSMVDQTKIDIETEKKLCIGESREKMGPHQKRTTEMPNGEQGYRKHT